MNHTWHGFRSGDIIQLAEAASWTNTDGTHTLPPGTVLILESWRPEGFTAMVTSGDNPEGKWFFLLEWHLRTARLVTRKSWMNE